MGIRFTCKNCLKRLNVKASQAGFKRQCPHCSAEVLVPAESTSIEHTDTVVRSAVRPPKQKFLNTGEEGTEGESVAVRETLPNRIHQRIRRPKDELLRHRPPDIRPEEIDQSGETFMLGKPQLPPTMGKVDPILQAPKQIWYLRNKELGEIGPLRGKVMQKRLDAGDITIGSLVWRGDWGGWIPAEKVFPSLVAKAEGIRLQQRRSRAFKELPIELRRPVPRQKKKLTAFERNRRKNRVFAAFVISGVVTILVLLVVAMKIVIDNP